MTDDVQQPPAMGWRAISTPPVFRSEGTEPPRLVGHFARFNSFNEIDSRVEGRFLERIQPGAFRKTFTDQGNRMRVLFQHGKDPTIGDQPIAAPRELREDETGPYFEADLLDGVPPLILSGLREGQYGVSYRFQVVREDWEPKPGKSDVNPLGLPERTIREAKVFEFGPVTFPADAGADVMVRSLTDQMTPPAPEQAPTTEPDAPSLDAEAPAPHLEPERRDEPEVTAAPQKEHPHMAVSDYHTLEDMQARAVELNAEIKRQAEIPGVLLADEQAAFDDRVAERAKLHEAIEAWRKRLALVADVPDGEGEPGYAPPVVIRKVDDETIYDVARVEREAGSETQRVSRLRDNAMRAVESARFMNGRFPRQSGQGDVAELLNGKDACEPIEVARRVLYTGKPAYRRAFHKYLLGQMMTAEEAASFEEARASLVTLSNTAVPFDLDTTMAIDTSGAVNPYREAFRVVKTTSNDWRPMISSGMVAVYVAESTAGSEAAPAFTAPARLLQKAHTVAKFSTEIQGDYPGLEAELAREISDAKDVLESVQFTTGAGTTVYPQGVFTWLTSNFLDTTTTLVIVPADLYKLEAWLGPRFRANSVWLGSPYFYSLVRGIDTAGGAGLWVDNLTQGGAVGNLENNGRLGNLLGHPAYEVGGLPATMATTEKVAALVNRERFVIIDRIGMNIELIPNFLSASTGYPTGERMVYAWWRNTSVGIGTATLTVGEAGAIFRGK